MERDPLDAITEYDSWRHQKLSKVIDFDSLLFMLFEKNAAAGEEVDWFFSVHILATGNDSNTAS